MAHPPSGGTLGLSSPCKEFRIMIKQGLYDPWYEHDACGVGFVVNINGQKSHQIVVDGLPILKNLVHRGAVSGDSKTGEPSMA